MLQVTVSVFAAAVGPTAMHQPTRSASSTEGPVNPGDPVPALPGSRRGQRRTGSGLRAKSNPLPPVPLSVWLSEPLVGCCRRCEEPTSAACANRLPLALARQITDAFSRSGDIVFVPDAGNATALIAAVQGGRKVLALVRGSDQGRRTQEHLHEQATELASLAIIRNAPAPGDLAAQSGRIAARAALTVLAPHDPVSPRELASLLDAAERALRPGGIVVICSRQTPGQDTAGTLTAHAQAAGFTYLQHIAAVEATATASRLQPLADTTDHGPDCTCPGDAPDGAVHTVLHNDLLVLTRP
ncbi:hypothetical protein [Streptacidiphilus albus]|uniref:hypothetical protein n=1 Tax=Streptacidiphilus albus TaxID=105425 RepID=UPI00054C7F49|nr:hypothetical protein [Streptacidiphilus albus]